MGRMDPAPPCIPPIRLSTRSAALLAVGSLARLRALSMDGLGEGVTGEHKRGEGKLKHAPPRRMDKTKAPASPKRGRREFQTRTDQKMIFAPSSIRRAAR